MKELYEHINNNDFSPSKEMLEAYFKGQSSEAEERLIEEWISTSDFGDEVGDLYSSELKNSVNWEYAKGNTTELFTKIKSNNTGFDPSQFLAILCSSIIILSLVISSNLYNNTPKQKVDFTSIKKKFQVSDEWVINEYMAPAMDVTDSIDKVAVKETYEEFKDSPLSLFNSKNNAKKEEDILIPEINSSNKKERLERKLVIQPMINDTSIFFSKKRHTTIYNHPVKYILNFKCIDYSQEYSKLKPVFSGLEPQFEPHKLRTETYPDMTEPVVVSFSVEEIMEEAFEAFALRNYKLAIHKFNLILDHYPNDLNAKFYKGLSYYEMGKYEEGIRFLKIVAQDDVNVFSEEAEWYLTKSHFKMGDVYIAVNLLNIIIDSNGYYAEHARRMLGEINEK